MLGVSGGVERKWMILCEPTANDQVTLTGTVTHAQATTSNLFSRVIGESENGAMEHIQIQYNK